MKDADLRRAEDRARFTARAAVAAMEDCHAAQVAVLRVCLRALSAPPNREVTRLDAVNEAENRVALAKAASVEAVRVAVDAARELARLRAGVPRERGDPAPEASGVGDLAGGPVRRPDRPSGGILGRLAGIPAAVPESPGSPRAGRKA